MPRSAIFVIVGILIVLLLAVYGIPWIKNAAGLGSKMDVHLNVISAIQDDNVYASVESTETVSRIVVEMELVFPYGSAPDNLDELSFKADDGSTVEINWGNVVDRHNVEDRSVTTFSFKNVFFPIDFKQGWLWNKNRELVYFRMPKLPYGAPPSNDTAK